jgi:hypothetical protein
MVIQKEKTAKHNNWQESSKRQMKKQGKTQHSPNFLNGKNHTPP